ncbi:MAG: hypothetical protein Q8S01_02840 [Ignavibacteria bacterium]|nr:hypothetical protein [Ignavibacteria bacterium]
MRKFPGSILDAEKHSISKVNMWHEFLSVIQCTKKSKSILIRQEIDGA